MYFCPDNILLIKNASEFFCCFTNLCLLSGEIAESNRHKEIDLHDDIIKWKHFCVTGPLALCEGNPQVTLKKDSGAEPWCFFCFVLFCFISAWANGEATIGAPMIWDAIALIMASLWWIPTLARTRTLPTRGHNSNNRIFQFLWWH